MYVTQLRTVLVQAGGQRLWPNIVFASGILLVAGIIVAGSFEITLILASHTHDYAVAHFVNFYASNNELLFLAGMDFLTLSAGLAILLNRGVAPLPKLLGWYSILVAVVGAAGPLSFFALLFGLPIWLLATGIVIAVKQRRGTLGGDTRRRSSGRRSAPAQSVPPPRTDPGRIGVAIVRVVQASPRTIATIFSPHSVGFCATATPAADSASILACAVPWEPEMMAPAWPILRPGGAVTPAM